MSGARTGSLLLCAGALASCHILGISAIPCDPDVDGQCPDGMVCRELTCVMPSAPSEGEGEGEDEKLGGVREVDRTCEPPTRGPQSFALDLSFDPTDVGTAGLPLELSGFGSSSVLTFDADACAARPTSCPDGAPDFDARLRAPVGTDAQIALAQPAELPRFDAQLSGSFAFEIIARVPSGPGTVMRVESGLDELFSLTTAVTEDGVELDLSLDGGVVVLGGGTGGRWVHVLCVIKPADARISAADGVLCAIDGGPPLYGSIGRADGLAESAVTFTLPLTGDSAIAWLKVWDNLTVPQDNLEVLDAIVALASVRLFSYAGMRALPPRSASAFALASNKLLPLSRSEAVTVTDDDAFALVGARWPRTVTTSDGTSPSLLLEPGRADLSARAFRECGAGQDVPFVGTSTPDALHAACLDTAGLLEVEAEAGFTAPLVFSAWVQGGDDLASLSIDMGGSINESCTITFPLGEPATPSGCGAMTVRLEEVSDLGLRRVVVVSSTSAVEGSKTLVSMSFDGNDSAAVWGAQIEQGLDATTVIDPEVVPGDGGREGDELVFHGAHVSLSDVVLRADLDAPDVDGAYGPIAIVRDFLFADSYVTGALAVTGAAIQASATLLDPIETNSQPEEIVIEGDTPGTLAPRTMFIASTDPSDACASSVGCAFVHIDPLPDGLAMTHLIVGGSGEVLRLRGASITATGVGSPPLAYAAVVEPRVNGCSYDAIVLAQLEKCDEHTAPTDCSDSEALTDLDAVEELSPLPGRTARALTRAVELPLALGAPRGYLLEARFRVPADDGPIVALTDDAGGPAVLALSSEGGAVRIDVRSASASVATEVDEWVQLLCVLHDPGTGQRVSCFRNLNGAPVFDTASAYGTATATLTIGADVAFDRVRLQEIEGELAPYALGVAVQRLPQSFGLHARLRREFAFVSAERAGVAYVVRNGGLFLVGAGWPRTSVANEKPAFLIEPALIDPLEDDFAQFAPAGGLSTSAEAGPGPRSLVFGAADVTVTASGLDDPGCVSVFFRRMSEEARVTLSVGGAQTRVDRGGGWQRASACSAPSAPIGEVTIEVIGEALLAHPQQDALAVTAPVVTSTREREWLQVDTRDLTLGLFGSDVSFDANVRGEGVILQLEIGGATASYAYRILRGFDADDDERMTLDLEEVTPDGTPLGSVFNFSNGLDPSGRISVSNRETSVWLRSATGANVGSAFLYPTIPATRLEVGARDPGAEGTAAVRLHELTVRPVLD